jgi:hypothetical protein
MGCAGTAQRPTNATLPTNNTLLVDTLLVGNQVAPRHTPFAQIALDGSQAIALHHSQQWAGFKKFDIYFLLPKQIPPRHYEQATWERPFFASAEIRTRRCFT